MNKKEKEDFTNALKTMNDSISIHNKILQKLVQQVKVLEARLALNDLK